MKTRDQWSFKRKEDKKKVWCYRQTIQTGYKNRFLTTVYYHHYITYTFALLHN